MSLRRPRLPRNHFTSAQHEQGWDGPHVVALRQCGSPVDVYLDELHLPGPLGRQLRENRADLAARSTPFGPEIDEHRDRGLLRDLGEICVPGVDDPG